ncbi:MAG: hypothetical protein WBN89_09535 [Prochlorococcaceae cyanobacterium]
MVDQEHLEALDFMLWMSGSHRAALIAYANQSTVIRRANTVLSIFGGEIQRSAAGWRVRGANELLHMERSIHQRFRFRGNRPLRLHAPAWSSSALCRLSTGSWLVNPSLESQACENPLELLTERIIDACLVTPTQIAGIRPDRSAGLVMVPIYRSAIDFVVWPWQASTSEAVESSPQQAFRSSSGRFRLHLFPFLPRSCRISSQDWFQQLVDLDAEVLSRIGAPEDRTYRAAFLTPEMQRALRLPFAVDRSFERPYTETLVFLAEHAGEPSIHQLVEALLAHFGDFPLRPRVAVGNHPGHHQGVPLAG